MAKVNNETKLSRKQIRDAAKKKARTKKTILKVILTTVISLVLVAAIGVGMFFAVYDPLGDNIKGAVKAMFTMPYDKPGSQDLTGEKSMFPLDQAAFFYFLNNYSEYMTEDCCMEIKDSVEYWNVWNRQTEYTVEPNEFAYKKSTGDTAYFETILDIRKDGELVDGVIMAGVFVYDPETNLITDINLDSTALIKLGEKYSEVVLGITPEENTDEVTE